MCDYTVLLVAVITADEVIYHEADWSEANFQSLVHLLVMMHFSKVIISVSDKRSWEYHMSYSFHVSWVTVWYTYIQLNMHGVLAAISWFTWIIRCPDLRYLFGLLEFLQPGCPLMPTCQFQCTNDESINIIHTIKICPFVMLYMLLINDFMHKLATVLALCYFVAYWGLCK